MVHTADPGAAPAPRLSLRPMSRLLPDFSPSARKPVGQGNQLGAVAEIPPNVARNMHPQPRVQSPWERRQNEQPQTSNPFNDPANPFADTQRAPPPLDVSPDSTMTAFGTGSATGPGPVAGPAARRSMNNKLAGISGPHLAGLAIDAPGDPVMGAARGAAGPRPGSLTGGPPASNVYRVQMDFTPSMDDELELRAGQLIRLLHEYDDGWVRRKQPPRLLGMTDHLLRLSAFDSTALNRAWRLALAWLKIRPSRGHHQVWHVDRDSKVLCMLLQIVRSQRLDVDLKEVCTLLRSVRFRALDVDHKAPCIRPRTVRHPLPNR